MTEPTYVLLETMLSGPVTITNIRKEKHLMFFTINDQEFCTAAGRVYHKNHPAFNSGLMFAIAEAEHDPVRILQQETENILQDADLELWDKHKREAYKLLLPLANEILKESGPESMEKFMERFFSIQPEDECKEFIRKLNQQ